MPIKDYGVLKGKASQRILATKNSEHYQILINEGDDPHRIAINTQSSEAPSQVLFYADDDFHHAITDALLQAGLPDAFTPLPSKPDGLALDFIRGNLFDVAQMVPLPSNVPGDNNDLNDKLDLFVQQAIADDDAVVYAFGQHWVDTKPDQYFPEIDPSTGIHDIHMNQGNPPGNYLKDNGPYQDGGLIFHFPSRGRWAAVFTAFQSQSFHTDDVTGNPLNNLSPTDPGQPENDTPLRIIAAMVNPKGDDPGKEYVILLNKGAVDINLSGWQIADKQKKKDTLGNLTVPAGDTLKVKLTGNGAQLSQKGGIITLLNKDGLKVDGVTYTQKDAQQEGVLVEL
ncbi:MAG: DUF2278 family protein [Chitinophagaceae bacterium]|nr:DUF2278 family protein [Chitinophagaceae bacterium]